MLSEYLTAIQCAGTMPPQETGETFNSWFGKAHLEMHWWHAAHFPLWNRAAMLERSLPWYRAHPSGGARERRAAGLSRRALAEDGRTRRTRQPVGDRRLPHLAAAASDLSGRARVPSSPRPPRARALSRSRVRVGGVHGVVSVVGPGAATVRARPAAHPGAGEPSAEDDLQPDVRARVLGVRSVDGAALARAARPRARAGVGPRAERALARSRCATACT